MWKKIILGISDNWSMSPLSQRPSKPAYYIEDWLVFTLGPWLLRILVVRFSLVSIFKEVETCLAHPIFPTGIPLLILIFIYFGNHFTLVDFFQVDFCQTQKMSKSRTWAYNLSQSMVIQNVCFFQNSYI